MYGPISSMKKTNSNYCVGMLPLGDPPCPCPNIYPPTPSPYTPHPLVPCVQTSSRLSFLSCSHSPFSTLPSQTSPLNPPFSSLHLIPPFSTLRERRDFANGMSYQLFRFTLTNPTSHWRIDLGDPPSPSLYILPLALEISLEN